MVVQMIGVLFGAHRPGWQPAPVESGLALLHLAGIALGIVAVITVSVRALRQRSDGAGAEPGDRVNQILAVAIMCNIGAEIVSTLSVDIMATRQISPVLPMTAALVGRVWGPRLDPRWARRTLAGVLAVLTVALVAYAPPRAEPADNQDIAEWLVDRNLSYGLGAFWSSNNITVTTSRKVTVVPVAGTEPLGPYCWQSKKSMYDKRLHDARFFVFELERPVYGTPEAARKQFGEPVEQRDFGKYVVLIYDFNLLDKLPPTCP
jgi:hypothetical protein